MRSKGERRKNIEDLHEVRLARTGPAVTGFYAKLVNICGIQRNLQNFESFVESAEIRAIQLTQRKLAKFGPIRLNSCTAGPENTGRAPYEAYER